MRRVSKIASGMIGLLILCHPGDAIAGENGRLIWSAFQCGTWAEMSGNRSEQARLFKVGYDAGIDFVRQARARKLNAHDTQNAPLIVLMLMQGPSDDFIVGRIFESASNDASASIVEKDKAGAPLPAAEWITDHKAKASLASDRYTEKNCALISQPRK